MTLGKTNAEFIRAVNVNRQSDGSLEERISQQSREPNEFAIKDENARKLREPMRELLSTERKFSFQCVLCVPYAKFSSSSQTIVLVNLVSKEEGENP